MEASQFYMITIFTPEFNRAHLMPRLHESLCKQTYRDFEWVIVDDGSVDDTKSLSLSLSAREGTFFPIRYFYQENGGKHRAINRGVKEARGELFFIADSDDILPPDALERTARVYDDIKDDLSFAGVCGLDSDFNGQVIGSGLPKNVIDDTSINIRFKYGVTGDMKEVFRTDVLKEFPFPEIDGERFCPEMLVWNRIATKYKLRYFNQVIYLAEYQTDGISSGIVKVRMLSPISSMMTYEELVQYPDVPIKEQMKAAINYWRFCFCSKPISYSNNMWKYFWVIPFAYFIHLMDLHK